MYSCHVFCKINLLYISYFVADVTRAGMTFGYLNGVNDQCAMSREAMNCILQALKLNSNDMALQEVLCRATANMSDDPADCKTLVRHGAVMAIINAFKEFPQSSKIAYNSLYFLENASKEYPGKLHQV